MANLWNFLKISPIGPGYMYITNRIYSISASFTHFGDGMHLNYYIYDSFKQSKPPVDLYLIFEKLSSTNWIFSLQKSIWKLIFPGYTGSKKSSLK